MIFFVYTSESATSITERLGLPDYSYFFVMEKFLPVLAKLGRVIILKTLADVDAQFAAHSALGRAVVLLSFTPPHRTPVGLRCPTFPVFAWEYSTIPSEAWGNDPRQNWAQVLGGMRGAITHSLFAADAVKSANGASYPVISVPAPLWNQYQRSYRPRKPSARGRPWILEIEKGVVLDSRAQGLEHSPIADTPSFTPSSRRLALDGIIYTSVFNPNDGRKNWLDLVTAFCFAFRDNPAATLVLKLVYCDDAFACGMVWHEMKKLAPYRCRVVAVQGYLSDGAYRRLVANTTYIVNSAYGEGQCLPLMEFMSAGKPAIAPNHTAMVEYVNEHNAFVVGSSAEWTHWAHDPRLLLRAFRYRIDWQSLRDAYLSSYAVAATQPHRYLRMSKSASDALREHCERGVAVRRLKAFFQAQGFSPAYRPLINAYYAVGRRVIELWKR
ncbi:MAG TPA: hypothetical protein VLC91_00870 [Spongiibacteraceae bacterium]|nr:hypothetical protein [Spongiibacteraceae bacterium]